MPLIWTFISSKLGIIVIAAALLAGFGFYHKATGWKHEAQVAKLEKDRDDAIQKWVEESQRAQDLEKKVKFQSNQLAREKKAQKETGDVDQAVKGSDIDFFRRNANRLYDYKNPTAQPPAAGSLRKRFKSPAQAGEVQR